jgi:hypothetical protein
VVRLLVRVARPLVFDVAAQLLVVEAVPAGWLQGVDATYRKAGGAIRLRGMRRRRRAPTRLQRERGAGWNVLRVNPTSYQLPLPPGLLRQAGLLPDAEVIARVIEPGLIAVRKLPAGWRERKG